MFWKTFLKIVNGCVFAADVSVKAHLSQNADGKRTAKRNVNPVIVSVLSSGMIWGEPQACLGSASA